MEFALRMDRRDYEGLAYLEGINELAVGVAIYRAELQGEGRGGVSTAEAMRSWRSAEEGR